MPDKTDPQPDLLAVVSSTNHWIKFPVNTPIMLGVRRTVAWLTSKDLYGCTQWGR